MASSSVPGVNLRRNGTLQSCERCRTTKIKCDHSTPRCGRCVAKGLDCVYEPAPMTRRFRAARFDMQSGRVRSTTRAQQAAVEQQPLPYVFPATRPLLTLVGILPGPFRETYPTKGANFSLVMPAPSPFPGRPPRSPLARSRLLRLRS